MKAVFQKAFHDSRRATFWLAFGLGLYVMFVMMFYPAMVEQSADFDELLQSYPDELLAMLYGGTAEDISLSDPATFVQTYFTIYALLILGVTLIVQAFNSITNAERDGTLDVMLSLPVGRRRYLLGRIANSMCTILIVLTVNYLVYLVSMVIWPEFDLSPVNLGLGILGALFPLMVVAGFSYLLAVLVPSSRHFAGPFAYLFLIGSYLVYAFSISIDQLKDFQPVFFYHYYNAGDIIRHGIDVSNCLILGAVAAIYFGLAWWRVDKKELGV